MISCFEQFLQKRIQLSRFNVTIACDYESKVNLFKNVFEKLLTKSTSPQTEPLLENRSVVYYFIHELRYI